MIITKPELLVVMNGPLPDKFENTVVPGGKVFMDSTLITRDCARDDVEAFKISAVKAAMLKAILKHSKQDIIIDGL